MEGSSVIFPTWLKVKNLGPIVETESLAVGTTDLVIISMMGSSVSP